MSPAELRARLSPAARRREWTLRLALIVGAREELLEVIRDPSNARMEHMLGLIEEHLALSGARAQELRELAKEGWGLLGQLRLPEALERTFAVGLAS